MNIRQKINLIKRWYSMLSGKSVFHVQQNIGKVYSKEELTGYYNDLTGKVTGSTIFDNNGIPINTTANGRKVYFPITIFQYALGAYDMYLLTKDKKYKNIFLKIVRWAINKQNADGSWNCFDQLGDKLHSPFSAMCQGEGASMLARAYKETGEQEYYNAAINAIEFMLKDVKEGGTTLYQDNYSIFQEYVSEESSSVLNGWIFAIFGLFDITKINTSAKYSEELERTLNTLKKILIKYDRGYWSNYDLQGTIASPSYHDLHIQQLKVLYSLFQIEELKEIIYIWEKYKNRKSYIIKAYINKIIQKIFFSKYDNGTSLIS